MMVVPEMNFMEMNVHAVGFPVPITTFARFFRQPTSAVSGARTQTRTRSPTDPQVWALLQEEFPWLTLAEIEQILNKKGGHVREGQPGEAQSSSGRGVWSWLIQIRLLRTSLHRCQLNWWS